VMAAIPTRASDQIIGPSNYHDTTATAGASQSFPP
jgi:hypothetical protein